MINTSLSRLLSTNTFSTLLVDASGVLYNDFGVFPGTVDAIKVLNRTYRVILLTNNTYSNVYDISEKLAKNGITIPPESIISSGLGLAIDPTFKQMIEQKKVFVFGTESSKDYISEANPSQFTTLFDADVVVLTASLKDGHEEKFQELMIYLESHPNIPVICSNPDQNVRPYGDKNLKKVIGYYAGLLERQGVHVHWMGKPYDSFSDVVSSVLKTRFSIESNEGVCFFDDNIENVINLTNRLGISGCLVRDTGLSKGIDLKSYLKKCPPQYCISEFSF